MRFDRWLLVIFAFAVTCSVDMFFMLFLGTEFNINQNMLISFIYAWCRDGDL